jgi:hypothetical protein
MTKNSRYPRTPISTVDVNASGVARRWSPRPALLLSLPLGLALALMGRFQDRTAQASPTLRTASLEATVFDGAGVLLEASADQDLGPGQAESILVDSPQGATRAFPNHPLTSRFFILGDHHD